MHFFATSITGYNFVVVFWLKARANILIASYCKLLLIKETVWVHIRALFHWHAKFPLKLLLTSKHNLSYMWPYCSHYVSFCTLQQIYPNIIPCLYCVEKVTPSDIFLLPTDECKNVYSPLINQLHLRFVKLIVPFTIITWLRCII